MNTTPVVYELDEHGQANGTVHYYCGFGCRSWSHYRQDDRDSSNFDEVPDTHVPAGTRCELCYKLLTPVNEDTVEPHPRIRITVSDVNTANTVHTTTCTFDEAVKHLGEGVEIWSPLVRGEVEDIARRQQWVPGLIVDVEYKLEHRR